MLAQWSLLSRRIWEEEAFSFAPNASSYTRHASKLLVAAPGKGEQTVHWDQMDGPVPTTATTMLLFCRDGVKSSAVPLFLPSDLQHVDMEEEFPDTPTMRSVYPLLNASEWFHSMDVEAGDVLVFSQLLPHFGTANPLAHGPRTVLFTMFSMSDDAFQDQFQVRTHTPQRTLPSLFDSPTHLSCGSLCLAVCCRCFAIASLSRPTVRSRASMLSLSSMTLPVDLSLATAPRRPRRRSTAFNSTSSWAPSALPLLRRTHRPRRPGSANLPRASTILSRAILAQPRSDSALLEFVVGSAVTYTAHAPSTLSTAAR